MVVVELHLVATISVRGNTDKDDNTLAVGHTADVLQSLFGQVVFPAQAGSRQVAHGTDSN